MTGLVTDAERQICMYVPWGRASRRECAAWHGLFTSSSAAAAAANGLCPNAAEAAAPSPLALAAKLPGRIRETLQALCRHPISPDFWSAMHKAYAHSDRHFYLLRAALDVTPRWLSSYWSTSPMCYYGELHWSGKTRVSC